MGPDIDLIQESANLENLKIRTAPKREHKHQRSGGSKLVPKLTQKRKKSIEKS